ncbi:hypothetical protein BMR1_02g00470 [Babesia microti strain RI]|uniref:Uncharacterized protein n=1 Tax=Babesia microti (strain RI) TaxID=1133968 RepID=I7IPV8_BABMR|nr:hypothetical protein BMR1_02g00470 [Babesia microti strain RI]CCF73260.1 hypothetical protein BMR1_02g00470 [Babesia microti strain RI]|eukprot:XP_012647869.1 hypothetical protein BMR1_02g00470 [Babesia microti strain RI]
MELFTHLTLSTLLIVSIFQINLLTNFIQATRLHNSHNDSADGDDIRDDNGDETINDVESDDGYTHYETDEDLYEGIDEIFLQRDSPNRKYGCSVKNAKKFKCEHPSMETEDDSCYITELCAIWDGKRNDWLTQEEIENASLKQLPKETTTEAEENLIIPEDTDNDEDDETVYSETEDTDVDEFVAQDEDIYHELDELSEDGDDKSDYSDVINPYIHTPGTDDEDNAVGPGDKNRRINNHDIDYNDDRDNPDDESIADGPGGSIPSVPRREELEDDESIADGPGGSIPSVPRREELEDGEEDMENNRRYHGPEHEFEEIIPGNDRPEDTYSEGNYDRDDLYNDDRDNPDDESIADGPGGSIPSVPRREELEDGEEDMENNRRYHGPEHEFEEIIPGNDRPEDTYSEGNYDRDDLYNDDRDNPDDESIADGPGGSIPSVPRREELEDDESIADGPGGSIPSVPRREELEDDESIADGPGGSIPSVPRREELEDDESIADGPGGSIPSVPRREELEDDESIADGPGGSIPSVPRREELEDDESIADGPGGSIPSVPRREELEDDESIADGPGGSIPSVPRREELEDDESIADGPGGSIPSVPRREELEDDESIADGPGGSIPSVPRREELEDDESIADGPGGSIPSVPRREELEDDESIADGPGGSIPSVPRREELEDDESIADGPGGSIPSVPRREELEDGEEDMENNRRYHGPEHEFEEIIPGNDRPEDTYSEGNYDRDDLYNDDRDNPDDESIAHKNGSEDDSRENLNLNPSDTRDIPRVTNSGDMADKGPNGQDDGRDDIGTGLHDSSTPNGKNLRGDNNQPDDDQPENISDDSTPSADDLYELPKPYDQKSDQIEQKNSAKDRRADPLDYSSYPSKYKKCLQNLRLFRAQNNCLKAKVSRSTYRNCIKNRITK